MMTAKTLPQSFTCSYSVAEEAANGISHGVGVLLGIVGLVLMLAKGWSSLDGFQFTSVILYGSSFILLFLSSTLYHSIAALHWKRRLKILDHCAIYLLIAGTYTPMLLISLANTHSEWVLIAIWSLAAGGVLFKSFFVHKFKALSLIVYLAMGWLCMAILPQLLAHLSPMGFWLLLSGGICYSLGVPFYAIKAIPFNHAIWHLFVLAGALCHFLCIYLCIIPAPFN